MENYKRPEDPRRRNRPTEEEGPGWGDILGGVAAVGAGIGMGLYAFSQMFGESSSKKNSEVESRRTSQEATRSWESDRQTFGVPSTSRFPSSSSNTVEWDSEWISNLRNTIVVAADATPDRCGGLIRMNREKQIYYYSAPWNPYYSFQKGNGGPDKFEMVNALVALTAFENIILENIRRSSTILTIKVDSNFCRSSYKNDDKELKDHIERTRKRFSGSWEMCSKNDDDMNIADKLSRRSEHEDILSERYPGYTFRKVDVEDTMIKIWDIVPDVYHN